MIVSNLHSPKERIHKNDVKACIEKICKQTNKEYLSNNEIKEIKTSISTISKWDEIKKEVFRHFQPEILLRNIRKWTVY